MSQKVKITFALAVGMFTMSVLLGVISIGYRYFVACIPCILLIAVATYAFIWCEEVMREESDKEDEKEK